MISGAENGVIVALIGVNRYLIAPINVLLPYLEALGFLIVQCVNGGDIRQPGACHAFSLQTVKTGKVSVDLGKAIDKVEDLRPIADCVGAGIDVAQVRWAQEQAAIFVEAMHLLVEASAPSANG